MGDHKPLRADRRTVTVEMTPHMAGALIAAANLVAGPRGRDLRGIGWDGTQLHILRLARAEFEQAVIETWDLGDVNTRRSKV